MNSTIHSLNHMRFEVLTDGSAFVGLGRIWIGDTLVRSGRLPLKPYAQTFKDGLELASLTFKGVDATAAQLRIRIEAGFRPLPVKLLRDHSFDPIHDTSDWDVPATVATGRLDIVIQPASDSFNGVAFGGFSYHYDWISTTAELFYILDLASWEIDGDITGATAYSQSSCSAPVHTFTPQSHWTTEGILPFLIDNPEHAHAICMTHNLPRWASHGSFDYQFKGHKTLIGVFDRVELIRSIQQRDAGKPELKTFDKHIFDQTPDFKTSAKSILLNVEPRTAVGQQNLWTWVHCEVERRARAEFGLKEEPFNPRIGINYWVNFNIDSYYKEMLPIALATGVKELFIDNVKKSAMTENCPNPASFQWNMCCGHEYEIAPRLGGNVKMKEFIDYCRERGIRAMSWTNNDQALSSPLNASERDDKWFVKLEDCRQKYGGAYAGCMSILDFSVAEAREYFIKSHIKIKEETGLDGYLFDSFYNLGFMPVTYRYGRPRTMWRGLLTAFKELQDAGVSFLIESFGPFGTPQHGHPSSYNFDSIFICYRVGVGNDYSTVPTGAPAFEHKATGATFAYYSLAHMAGLRTPTKMSQLNDPDQWSPGHRSALEDYLANQPHMYTRYLQEDGQSVLWHNAAQTRATLFNFRRRSVSLPGVVTDLTTGQTLPPSSQYQLQDCHTYSITGAALPTSVG